MYRFIKRELKHAFHANQPTGSNLVCLFAVSLQRIPDIMVD